MTRVAILSPATLLGREVRDLLEGRGLADDLDLLSADEEEVGTVTESRGAATLVAAATAEALADADLVFACGPLEVDEPLVEARPEGATAILLSPSATVDHGQPVVAGVNPEAAAAGAVLLSPHPAAISLAHLLAPLGGLGLEGATATVVLPVSMIGDRGLEDLLEQTRDLLAMTGEQRPSVFDRQLAFNLYPAPEAGGGLAELVRAVLALPAPLAIHPLQGAVFHGVAVSLFVRFEEDPGLERVREALAGQEHVAMHDVDAEGGAPPGPTAAAAREEILVGSIHSAAGAPGGYWIWAVMDNLTRGGALNAVEIAERVMGLEK